MNNFLKQLHIIMYLERMYFTDQRIPVVGYQMISHDQRDSVSENSNKIDKVNSKTLTSHL